MPVSPRTLAGRCRTSGQPFFKRLIPPRMLAAADGLIQGVGAAWKLSPSIFLRTRTAGAGSAAEDGLFCCPSCRSLDYEAPATALMCEGCGAAWSTADGIYDFKAPL